MEILLPEVSRVDPGAVVHVQLLENTQGGSLEGSPSWQPFGSNFVVFWNDLSVWNHNTNYCHFLIIYFHIFGN